MSACGAILAASFATSEAFGPASYDPKADELVVTVFYSGTNAEHEFSLRWDPCVAHPDGSNDAQAQLIDSQARDTVKQEYQKTVRLSLRDLPCRPATVTLRAGPRAYVAVDVPEAP